MPLLKKCWKKPVSRSKCDCWLFASCRTIGTWYCTQDKTETWESAQISAYDLVVNATSAGLEDENLPAPLELLRPLLEKASFCADVIYGKVTPFLKLAAELGITSKDGSDMLLGQGVLAGDYFTEKRYDRREIERYMKESFLF